MTNKTQLQAGRDGPDRDNALGVSGREEGQGEVGQESLEPAGSEGAGREGLLSLVGEGRRKLPPVGPEREEKASRGQSILPRVFFPSSGSDDRCWAQAAAGGWCWLPWLH